MNSIIQQSVVNIIIKLYKMKKIETTFGFDLVFYWCSKKHLSKERFFYVGGSPKGKERSDPGLELSVKKNNNSIIFFKYFVIFSQKEKKWRATRRESKQN